MDSNNQTKMLHLKDVLKMKELSLNSLRKMNRERKSRQQKSSQKTFLNRAAKNYFETFINFEKNPEKCARKLYCMKSMSNHCFNLQCE